MNKSFSQRIIFVGSILLSNFSMAGLPVQLDPWGHGQKTSEYKQKRDDFKQQTNTKRTQIETRKSELNQIQKVLEERKSTVIRARTIVEDNLVAQELALNDLKQGHLELLRSIGEIKNTAAEFSANLITIESDLTFVRGTIDSLRILKPFFKNTAESRNLWIKVLEKLSANQSLSEDERSPVLKVVMSLRDMNDYFWEEAPNSILIDVHNAIKLFSSKLPNDLVQALRAETNALVASLATEEELAKTIGKALVEIDEEVKKMELVLK